MRPVCTQKNSSRLKWTVSGLSLAVIVATAADWPQYRGSNHDGVSSDRINKQWSGSVTIHWLVLSNGVCSFAVSAGQAFTQVFQTNNGLEMESAWR
jgi:hypothetical protein